MFKNKNSSKVEQAATHGASFELTLADRARRSERRAWIVAFCCLGVVVIMAIAIMLMLPLKEREPFIVLADPYSGTSQVARLTDDLVNRKITASEAINRSNVAHFIIARESYDLAVTNLRDWPTVLTMATPEVAGPYMALHSAQNASRPYNLYGRAKAVRVKILSIVLMGGERGTTPKGATVRFQRSIYDKSTGSTTPLDSKIATMEFVYKPNLRMDDQNRIENPLGFRVTAYRVDNDFASAPPAEVPTASQQTGMAPPAPVGDGAADAPAAPSSASIGVTPSPAAVGIPSSPLPADTGVNQPSTSQPSGTAPTGAVSPVPQSAANGGRR